MTLTRFKWDAIVVFLTGLLLFILGLSHQEVIGFESRFYLFALEMWRHGFTWFPTTYHMPYPDYPVTSTALIYLSAILFGTLNKGVAVFPSALAAAFTLSATYLIGALHQRRLGWYGVGFLLLTLAFLTEARTISLDMYVTAITTWLFYFAYSAKLNHQKPTWSLIGILLMISFAIRGPIGIVIPTGVLSVFYLLEKDWKSWIFLSLFSVLLLLAATGLLLSVAYHVGGDPFVQKVLRMEVLGRMEPNRTPSFYFYFVESIGAYAVTYPLVLLVLFGTLLKTFKKTTIPDARFLWMLIGWVLVIMLGLSLPADKKVRYILPIAPALALICSHFLMHTTEGWLFFVKKIFYILCGIFPLLGLVALALLYHHDISLNYTVLVTSFVIMQLFVLVLHRHEVCFIVAVLSFFIANVFFIEKINLDSNQTKSFVQKIEDMRKQYHAKLAFYREGRDGLAIKYLVNMPEEDDPLFLEEIKEVSVVPIFLILSEENVNTLLASDPTLHRIALGKIGHDTVVVFMKN